MAIDFDPDEIMAAIEAAVIEDLQETAGRIHRTVVLASPVGDPTLWQMPEAAPAGYVGGSFRGNWLIGVGADPVDESPAVDPSGALTIREGELTLRLDVTSLREPIFIVNDLPYANRLNNGWSTQAPAGFVEQSIAQGVAGGADGTEAI